MNLFLQDSRPLYAIWVIYNNEENISSGYTKRYMIPSLYFKLMVNNIGATCTAIKKQTH